VRNSGTGGVVDAIVVVAQTEQSAATQHRNQPEQEGDRSNSDRQKPVPAASGEARASRQALVFPLVSGDAHGNASSWAVAVMKLNRLGVPSGHGGRPFPLCLQKRIRTETAVRDL
jgi:hypothetical protein